MSSGDEARSAACGSARDRRGGYRPAFPPYLVPAPPPPRKSSGPGSGCDRRERGRSMTTALDPQSAAQSRRKPKQSAIGCADEIEFHKKMCSRLAFAWTGFLRVLFYCCCWG